jgi:hypothetical protein
VLPSSATHLADPPGAVAPLVAAPAAGPAHGPRGEGTIQAALREV